MRKSLSGNKDNYFDRSDVVREATTVRGCHGYVKGINVGLSLWGYCMRSVKNQTFFL